MVKSVVKTPCIGVCSTGIGDDVCRGCKRFTHEVIHWNSYSDRERRIIWQRLDQLLAQVVKAKVLIWDAEKLLGQMSAQQIDFDESRNPYCLFQELLKAGASQIKNLSEYGCQLTSEYAATPLVKLRILIDADFYTLSQVHYQRYFIMPEHMNS
ncbi:DUF1289 domain-containing protein [Teredinibacter sp. KSP-S5-2]|uniref:DUF1289 domain-containing protein n=1 Tax=Teredinibacter sp. KSP-S5-2 TaxID=3034506 RepID=UPI002934C119|nr:DUF1289 domain-containing protein [Teredinibacter sp. KSP-S5-2]WNO07670.1 DUF1289 domain-containing protein [Teredinibacter sp. KSP-S5-2]